MPIQVTVERANVCHNERDKRIKIPCIPISISNSTDKSENSNHDVPDGFLDITSVTDKSRHDVNKIRKNFFPYRLMGILSSPLFEDCATWDHEGKSFAITDMEKFSSKSNLSSSTLRKESFARKLNRWGFRMNKTKGCGYYSHPLFCRDKPWLCESMRCKKTTNSQNDIRSDSPKKITEKSSKRSFDDYDDCAPNTSEILKKRRIEDKDLVCKFDLSKQSSVVLDFFKYLVDKSSLVLGEDYIYNRLGKYLIQRQVRSREIVRILMNAGKESSVIDREVLKGEKSSANIHNAVIRNAILALVS